MSKTKAHAFSAVIQEVYKMQAHGKMHSLVIDIQEGCVKVLQNINIHTSKGKVERQVAGIEVNFKAARIAGKGDNPGILVKEVPGVQKGDLVSGT